MDEKVTLAVEGMTCSSCAQGISRHLAKKGLKDVEVNYEDGRVVLTPVEGFPVSKIIGEINSLGYSASEAAIEKKANDTVNKLQRKFFFCLAFTVPLLMHMFFSIPFLNHGIVQFILCLPVLLTGLEYFGRSAWGSLKSLQPNMDVLILTGAVSAFIYSTAGLVLHGGNEHHYLFFESSAAIITFVLLGNLIEHKSLKKTTEAVSSLLLLQPVAARKIFHPLTDQETTKEVGIEQVHKNDLLLINTGERVPADGQIYWGDATIDESAMTGEFMAAEKKVNDTVLAGTIILKGSVKMIVTAAGNATVLNNVISLVRQATSHKPDIQRLGDKVSSWFVPVVILIAFLTFIVSRFFLSVEFSESLLRSIAVLVISCPCAMGLATPTAVSVAIGRASKEGILIKGGHLLELFSRTKMIFFDKTGTLTEAQPVISRRNFYASEQEILYIIHSLEQHSTHPAAKALCTLQPPEKNYKPFHFTSIEEEKGFGVKAIDSNGNSYYIGSGRGSNAVRNREHNIYILKNDSVIATFDLEEGIRPDAAYMIDFFRKKGIRTALISGDREQSCSTIAQKLGIDEVHAGLLPHEKAALIDKAKGLGVVAMVGDGINDAPSLANADIGISFGSATHIAMNTAGIIIMNVHQLRPVVKAFELSAAALTTIRQNLFWALIYNVVAIPVAAAGYLSPIISSFSMAFSDVVVIGNSLRLRIKNIFDKKTAV